jgi:hypothetical protein
MPRTPKPELGQRIRVTAAAGIDGLDGATGSVADIHQHAISVRWDTERWNRLEVTLVKGVDRWEVIDDAPPPDA